MNISPVLRLCIGLTMLLLSALLFAKFLGVVPDTHAAELEARKVISESLAVQVSSAIARDELQSATRAFRSVVDRNQSVLSIGLRNNSGDVIAQAGNHQTNWNSLNTAKSTPTHIVVPLFKNQASWGAIEVRFRPLGMTSKGVMKSSFFAMAAFLIATSFIAFYLLLSRTFRDMNPNAVIPQRVRTALDTLSDGILIIDKKERIAFANDAFISKTGMSSEELIGQPAESLGWQLAEGTELPWISLMRGDAVENEIPIVLETAVGEKTHFVTNATPITSGPKTAPRGVMATFDDVTELEKANTELRHVLKRLENNEVEIRQQNRELQILATRDPLTGCLNRRSLFKGSETLFSKAVAEASTLSCIMADIDKFKSINDNYGHGVGDKVIKLMAQLMLENAAPDDLVGRYGGEEFCIIMPGVSATQAAARAEAMRSILEQGFCTTEDGMRLVTASFGVAELTSDTSSQQELVDQADRALYNAKNSGRNQVQIFDKSTDELDLQELATEQEKHAQTMVTPTRPMDRTLAINSNDGVLERVTSIPGRQLLLDRASQSIIRAKRYRHTVSAVSVRIRATTRVRDTLGDMAAEKFRTNAVNLLRKRMRSSDTVETIGELKHCVEQLGSEQIFILLTDIENTEQVSHAIRRIQTALAGTQEIAGNQISMAADIGVSIYPEDSLDAVALMRHANSAMNSATGSSSACRTRYYSKEIDVISKRQLQIETELRRAIDKKEFFLHYQPKICLNSGNIIGVEALLRWHSASLGFVPPDKFIPIAEQIGCIEEISAQTITTACKQIALWRDAGFGNISIAVNLSPVEFLSSNLAHNILEATRTIGIDPALLEIEITESVVMDESKQVDYIMKTLTEAGIRISIDDFGTGYATMQCLTRYPVSTIKVDRSFINGLLVNPQDSAVVGGIISLAHTLGLHVVAEGVEESEQLDYLRDLNCDHVQGYYLCRPVPAEEIRELLENPIRMKSLALSGDIATHTAKSETVLNGILNVATSVE